MPSPPMRTRGRARPRILAQASVASASSEPLRRLFISSLTPRRIENSAPRRIRRTSPPPGTAALPSWIQGIIDRPRAA